MTDFDKENELQHRAEFFERELEKTRSSRARWRAASAILLFCLILLALYLRHHFADGGYDTTDGFE